MGDTEVAQNKQVEKVSERTAAELKASRKEEYLQRKELGSLEGKIERLEKKTGELRTALGLCDYGSATHRETSDQIKKNEAALATAQSRWEELVAILGNRLASESFLAVIMC